MNFHKFFTIFLLFISISTFAQKTIKHTVVSGESIYSIAKKYKITEDEIYALNPKTKGAILSLNTVLTIPNVGKNKSTENSNSKNKSNSSIHVVEANESFYTIAQKYDLSVENLKDFNPTVSPKKLQIGTKLNLKLTKEAKKEKAKLEIPETKSDASGTVIHKVKKGETLSSIAEKHGMLLSQLMKLNPNTGSKIQIGDELIIKKPKVKKEIVEVIEKPVEIVVPKVEDTTSDEIFGEDAVEEPDDSGNLYHVVVKGETLSKISRQYDVKLKKLKQLNPNVGDNLAIGHTLLIKEVTPVETIEPIVKYAEIEPFIEDLAPLSAEGLSKADYLIQRASEHIGTKYRSGGTSAGGFDCSGFMIYTFKEQENIKLPRTSASQSNYGKKVKKAQAQKGDLIFFTTNGRGNINHVGMITEVLDNEIKFIHSSVSRGVIISSTREPYYAKRFVKIMRVIEE